MEVGIGKEQKVLTNITKITKKKILFISSDVRQCIGYSRISHRLLNHLAEEKNGEGSSEYEIHHFAFSNFESMQVPDRQINKNIHVIDVLKEEAKIGSSELYGVDLIEKKMEELKPDILFIYNDLIVTCRLFNALLEYKKKNNYYKTVVYIDLVYDYERYDMIQHLDRNTDLIFVFTQHWKDNLVKMSVASEKIKIVHHGINSDQIQFVEKKIAREKLNLFLDDFIVLNTNRNSYRKGWDITISAFIKFLKKNNLNPKIKLFINCLFENLNGYMLHDLIQIECIKQDVNYNQIVNTNFIKFGSSMSGLLTDETVNYLYNACDIGLNTCIGEGFGLCNMEHAAVGAPQIVTNVGGLTEIFKNGHSKLINPIAEFYIANSIDGHGGYVSICNPSDFAEEMDYYYKNINIRKKHGKDIKKDINSRFQWPPILEQFSKDLRKL